MVEHSNVPFQSDLINNNFLQLSDLWLDLTFLALSRFIHRGTGSLTLGSDLALSAWGLFGVLALGQSSDLQSESC